MFLGLGWGEHWLNMIFGARTGGALNKDVFGIGVGITYKYDLGVRVGGTLSKLVGVCDAC